MKILIISKQNFEDSTNDVIKWLINLQANYKRLNGEEIVKMKCKKGIFNFKFNEIGIVWFRRSYDNEDLKNIFHENFSSENKSTFFNHLRNEKREFFNYFLYSLKDCLWLSHPKEVSPNKLIFLRKARDIGLKTPDYIITSRKSDLFSFFKNHNENIITKSIKDSPLIQGRKGGFVLKTGKILKNHIEELPDFFYPSIFQEYIEKEFEIRVFFIDDKFYSMAIFSQLDPKTKVDFRNYNLEKPNRVVPFVLPIKIKSKLKEFIKTTNLTTGSFDLIKSKKGNYYFLEVNPVGQFGMTSFPCNYQLEKKIAEFLIKKNEESKNER